ncbi:MAG: hypothetical protein ABR520_06940 [Mycobacteriales bacterium]|nr:hypothetical protein [Frankia sp.]
MKLRIAALAGAVTLGALASASHAAPPAPKPQVTDPAGDANAINGQGLQDIPSVSTAPASVDSMDVLSVLYETYGTVKGGKVVKADGFRVTMTLSAAPQSTGAVYRATGAAPDCSVFWFQYDLSPGAAPEGNLRHTCGVTDPTDLGTTIPLDVKVDGAKIVWTVPLKVLPPPVKLGSLIEGIGVDIRVNTSVVTAPAVDQAPETGVYKIGS